MKKYIVMLLLCACTTVPKGPIVKTERENLIPDGTYEQRIQLTISRTDNSEEKHFSFSGILRIEKNKILVVALSPFGTTEFKLEDNGKEIKTEIYREAMKKAESKITEYYTVLKSLLRAKQAKAKEPNLIWTRENELGLPLELKSKEASQFHIKRYNESCIPVEMSITNKGFKVDVRVTSYEEN